ncbi:hypothetical protein [Acidicapsa ligni]|uniref:hypothetical protein n=1 Tax=Acidicapsa ligni TaxID=542300 RepID=UPI0021E07392|nr:hypothetical protein [Acidicapsa ligni]
MSSFRHGGTDLAASGSWNPKPLATNRKAQDEEILLQTTIPYIQDDWSIERFSTLTEILSASSDEHSSRKFEVVSRNRDNPGNVDDCVLKKLDETDFDQLWLFGVDVGAGITAMECEAIARFRARGGGLLTSRDHQDLGLSLSSLVGIGDAHHFHSRNPEPDPARLIVDDIETSSISYPNYHSGKNGDYQYVTVMEPLHPVMRSDVNRSGRIELLPSHPHEGTNSIPMSVMSGRVIATGTSILTGRVFNLALAFEADGEQGRAIVDSSFHHFLDYNLDSDKGCPSYVTEPAGNGLKNTPQARADTKTYFLNLAEWLS